MSLVTPDTSFEGRVRTLRRDWAEQPARRWREEYLRVDPTKVAARIAEDGAVVAVLGPGLPVELAVEVARAMDVEHPHVCVVIVAEPTSALLEEALRAGVRDVVAPTADDAALRSAINRAVDAAARRRPVAETAPDAVRSRLVTVLSPKGGSGKTTVATNLAVALARGLPGQVAIVDLDLQFGDVASALQLEPEHTMRDVARAPAPIDATTLKVFLTQHPSGLHTLAAPPTPAAGDDVADHHSAHALRVLHGELPWVVVDTAAGLGEHTLAAIELSTDLVFVCSMDVTSVRSLRKELDALDELGLTAARRHFVLNRSDARVGLDAGDVEAVVGLPVDVAVPSSRSVPLSMNQGSPLVESEPRSAVARQLQAFADRLADRPNPGTGRPGVRLWRKEQR